MVQYGRVRYGSVVNGTLQLIRVRFGTDTVWCETGTVKYGTGSVEYGFTESLFDRRRE